MWASTLPTPEMDRVPEVLPGGCRAQSSLLICAAVISPPSIFILSVSPYCCCAKPFCPDFSPLTPPVAVSISATRVHGGGKSCRLELASLYTSLPAPRVTLPTQRAVRAGEGSTPALLCYNEPFQVM